MCQKPLKSILRIARGASDSKQLSEYHSLTVCCGGCGRSGCSGSAGGGGCSGSGGGGGICSSGITVTCAAGVPASLKILIPDQSCRTTHPPLVTMHARHVLITPTTQLKIPRRTRIALLLAVRSSY